MKRKGDSAVVSSYSVIPSYTFTDSTTLLSQATVQPLSPELVHRTEEAVAGSGATPIFDGWDLLGLRSSATILDKTEELTCVLDNIPSRWTDQTNQALSAQGDGGQGILFMNGIELALKSAQRLKEVVGYDDVLYELECHIADEPVAQQEYQICITSAKNASDKFVAEDPSAASGGGACDKTRKREVESWWMPQKEGEERIRSTRRNLSPILIKVRYSSDERRVLHNG